ncbi:hypothetical protein ABT093_37795 [Kitasatospora sp. NPDC002551]|uniref:hypothetical protein n=1 Tax=Kitasatospora sp. NPDC002551 TaxID=3154539 RepID=UPI00333468E8
MIHSRLAKALAAVLCFTALVVLSLYSVGMLSTDSLVGTSVRAGAGGILAAATLGLVHYLASLVRTGRDGSEEP